MKSRSWLIVTAAVMGVFAGLVGAGGAEGSAPEAFTRLDPAAFEERMKNEQAMVINVHVPYEGELAGTDAFIPFPSSIKVFSRCSRKYRFRDETLVSTPSSLSALITSTSRACVAKSMIFLPRAIVFSFGASSTPLMRNFLALIRCSVRTSRSELAVRRSMRGIRRHLEVVAMPVWQRMHAVSPDRWAHAATLALMNMRRPVV